MEGIQMFRAHICKGMGNICKSDFVFKMMPSPCFTCNMPGLVSNSYPVRMLIYFVGLFIIEHNFRFHQSVAFHISFVLYITSKMSSFFKIIIIMFDSTLNYIHQKIKNIYMYIWHIPLSPPMAL